MSNGQLREILFSWRCTGYNLHWFEATDNLDQICLEGKYQSHFFLPCKAEVPTTDNGCGFACWDLQALLFTFQSLEDGDSKE